MRKGLFFATTFVAFLSVGLFTSCSSDEETLFVNQEAEFLKPVDDNPYAVTIEEAQKQLEEILAKTDGNKTRSGAIRKIKNKFTTGGNTGATRSEDGEEHPVVHVFNFEDNGGFAIMAGDKRATPLIALTEDGNLQERMSTDNLGLITRLVQAEQVYKAQLEKTGGKTRGGTPSTVTVIDTIPIPLEGGQCPVEWHQNSPYNSMCPNLSKAGSAAVAMAQYMACTKYPDYYGVYGFHWNNMIAGNNNQDIANLMYLLGLPGNLDMNYTTAASYCDHENIPTTFENFGYTHSELFEYENDSLINELSSSHPVLIIASQLSSVTIINAFNIVIYYNASYTPHVWLADGIRRIFATTYYYDGNNVTVTGPFETDYIHCNFGFQSNSYNGYYLADYYTLSDPVQQTVVDPNTLNRYIYTNNMNYIFDQQLVTVRR